MLDIPTRFIKHFINEEPLEEGDIFIVEYDEIDNRVLWVYQRDDKERIRRLDIIKRLINKIG